MKSLDLQISVRRIVEDFVMALKDIYGEELISATLYGSAASGEYISRHSNLNLAIVLRDTSLASLSKISRLLNKRRFDVINPVFFTEDYIRRSTDVFPIEFLDMKENNALLYGKDILGNINIDIKNLRFQCEQELKSKILNIKKLYLRVSGKAILKDLLFKSLTSSLHILRNLVRLKGKVPAYSKGDIIDEVAEFFSIDVTVLKDILNAKNRNLRLDHKEVDRLFNDFVDTLEEISDKVDVI